MSNVSIEKAIFQAAILIAEPRQRDDYVDIACQGDDELRGRIVELLAAISDDSFMHRPAIDLIIDKPESQSKEHVSRSTRQRIGNYKLLQQIGEGGFGTVYMADQESPVRRRVLFAQVCGAIQHAHQKGVIHRDIKPNNIMVTLVEDKPVPKVIDFGIAKATQQPLTDKTLFTAFAQLIGTPAYMSPEQAQFSSDDVDTRSDVYSLGVLLYELIVGMPPFDPEQLRKCGYEEVCRRIREDDPPTPSTRLNTLTAAQQTAIAARRGSPTAMLSKQFRGDLDWIVMKALEKDRRRRYETANNLADDVRRFLNHEPVSAAAPSLAYQLRKLYSRNRAAVTAAVLIGFALCLGTAVSSWQAIRATRATAKAVEAEQVADGKTRLAIESEATVTRNLYATEMAAAKRSLDEMDTQRTLELLTKYFPQPGATDLRGFEWRWLWNQSNRELFQLRPNSEGVQFQSGWNVYRDMRFSADGKWLATGSTDGAVRLWDFENRRQVWQFVGGHHCNAIDFSADGRCLLANFYDSNGLAAKGRRSLAHLHDPTSAATVIWDIAHPAAPIPIATIDDGVRFLPDGETLVAFDGAHYDRTGNMVGEPYIDPLPDSQLWARTYSKDWKTLATKNRIWDVPSRTLLATLPSDTGYIDAGSNGIAISPQDNNVIATGSANGIRIWDRRGNLIRKLSGTGGTPVAWLCFSNNGDFLAVRQSIGAVRVYETETWTEVDAVGMQPGNSVLFSPTENNLFVAGGRDGVIRAFRVSKENASDAILQHPTDLLAMKFSPDGRVLAVGMSDGAVRFWDVNNQAELFTTPPKRTDFNHRPLETSFGPDYVAFSPDSRFAAVIGPEQTVSVWDIDQQRIVYGYTCEPGDGIFRNAYYAVCFSRTGTPARREKTLAQTDGQECPSYYLFGAVRGASRSIESKSPMANSYSPNWREFGHIDVWEWPGDGERLRLMSEHAGQVKCLDVSSDGRLLAGSQMYNDRPIIWLRPNMRKLGDVQTKGGWSIEFSPDGSLLAVGGSNVKLCETQTLREIAVLRHAMRVEHVSWSPDGSRLAASDIIGNTKLWNVETRHVVATFRGTISAFSPDGLILAVGGPGSKYTGDEQHASTVTLHYAPPLDEIDGRIGK